MDERYVEIGKILDRFKIKDEIKIKSYLDNLDEFIAINEFYIKTLTGFKKINITFKLKTPQYLIYRIENINPELIVHLKGKEIFTLYKNLPKLREGEYYVVDLEECYVFEHSGEKIGKIEKVIHNGKMFFLEFSNFIIPLSERYVKSISIEKREIILSEEFSKEKEFLR
ncbi:MAG: ribosome maturation factor RimM [Brevinematia bacterium]